MKSVTIKMPYIGNVLSVNHYLGRRRGGYYVKPETKQWMEELGWLIKSHHIEEWKLPLKVTCDGVFKDKRGQPDIHNLMKVICDSIEEVTGVNDKHYQTETGSAIIDKNLEPELTITIEEV